MVITQPCDFGLRRFLDFWILPHVCLPPSCLSFLLPLSTFSLTFMFYLIFPICYQEIYVLAMFVFTHLALLLPPFLALIVPGTFIARQDAPDIYKQYTTTTQASTGLNHRTTTHLCRRHPQSKILNLSTRIDHKMTSNLQLHLTACHLLLHYLITISTWMLTLLTPIGITHHLGLMLTQNQNQNRTKTLHHWGIGISGLLTLHILLELIIPQSAVRDVP